MQLRKILGLVSIAIFGGLMGGCSTVQVHPVSVAQANNPSISGVRFFEPMPYLLVTQMPMHPQPMMLMRTGPHPQGMSGHRGPMAMRKGWKHGHGPFHGRHFANRGPHGKLNRMKKHGPMMNRWMGGHPMPPQMPMMAQQRVLCLQIIYLPDYSHPYVADLKGGLGHSKNSIVLANGWELLGINAQGHLTEPPPVRGITAMPMMAPMMPLMGGPMQGPMAWKHHGKSMMHGRHAGKMGRKNMHHRAMNHQQMMHRMMKMHRMMMRRMMMMHRIMMSRQAAMAIGLHPGLYRFVFNAKTGRLECLQPVKFMTLHHHGHFRGGWKFHKKWNKKWHKKWTKPMAKPAPIQSQGSM
jgi:hypothetical protein